MKLNSRIIIILIVSIIVTIIGITQVLIPQIESNIVSQLEENIHEHLDNVEKYLSEFMNYTRQDIAFLLTNPEFYTENDQDFTTYLNATKNGVDFNPQGDESVIIEIFNRYKASKPQIEFVYTARENGSFVMDSPIMDVTAPKEKLFDYDPRVRPWYVKALENPEELIVTDLYPAMADDNDVMNEGAYDYYVTAAKAIKKDDKILGVLGIDINLNVMSEYLKGNTSKENGVLGILQEDSIISINDTGGIVLDEDLTENEWIDEFTTIKSGGSQIIDIEGESYLVFSKAASNINWTLYYSIPLHVIEQDVRNITMPFMMFSSLIVTLFSMVIFIGLRKYVLRPISIISSGLNNASHAGRLSQKIVWESKDEFGMMTNLFNNMIEDIDTYQNKLEDLVKDRTHELEKFSKAIDHSSFTVVITDTKGNIEYVKY